MKCLKESREGVLLFALQYQPACLEAQEVEAGVLPLDLWKEELAVREFGKIHDKVARVMA